MTFILVLKRKLEARWGVEIISFAEVVGKIMPCNEGLKLFDT